MLPPRVEPHGIARVPRQLALGTDELGVDVCKALADVALIDQGHDHPLRDLFHVPLTTMERLNDPIWPDVYPIITGLH